MVNIEEILEQYIPYGEPIPYQDFLIYPIKVCDSWIWKKCSGILEMDKNSMNNIDIIKMSYLKFIIELSKEDETYLNKLETILRLCLKLEEEEHIFCMATEKDDYEIFIGSIINKGIKQIPDYGNGRRINSKQFDEIKKIILYQNIYDFDDSYVDPDVKKAVQDFYDLVNRDSVDVSLEEQIACVQSFGMSDINNMTYRSFSLVFSKILDRLDYQVFKTAELSGNIEFKKPIEHWVYKKKKGKFGDAFISMDAFQQKMGNSSMANQSTTMSEEEYMKEERKIKNVNN